MAGKHSKSIYRKPSPFDSVAVLTGDAPKQAPTPTPPAKPTPQPRADGHGKPKYVPPPQPSVEPAPAGTKPNTPEQNAQIRAQVIANAATKQVMPDLKASRAAAPGAGISGFSALSVLLGPNIAAHVPGTLTPTGQAPHSTAAGTALDAALLLPFLRGPRAVVKGITAARRGEKAAAAAKAAFQEPAVRGAVRDVKAYRARTLKVNDLEQQVPRARSRITRNAIEKPADAVSRKLDKSGRARSTPGVRLATASERATKAAGRSQRVERGRTEAVMAQHLRAIKAVKPGSVEDTANFWYAQLPASHRNAAGLKAVQDMQRQHLEYLTSGKALEDATARIRALRGKLHATSLGHAVEEAPANVIDTGVIVHAADQNNYGRVVGVRGDTATVHFVNRGEGTEATVELPLNQLTSSGMRVKPGAEPLADTGADVFPLLRQIEDTKLYMSDIPNQVNDASASIGHLDGVIAKAPRPNDAAIAAVHALGEDSSRVLIDAGRLNPKRVEPRKGLLANAVGVTPTGEEAYIGHRLPTPETRYPYTPKGGTGRVKTPTGMASENKLVLAKTGRLRPSLRAAAEDWHSVQTFREANVARDTLGKLGTEFTGHVPADSVLVNPKGRTVPPNWKNEDLAQFQDSYDDVDAIRKKAQQIVDEFSADGSDRAAVKRLMDQAVEQGVQWNELRVVPRRLVERYYGQYRPTASRGKAGKAYDTLVDGVAASIVFARIGYIPKNVVQNVVMALPHQGPLVLRNATWSAQIWRGDKHLWDLLRAEVGYGASGTLAQEARSKKIIGAPARVVGSIADDPLRIAAFLHEAAAEHVISGTHPFLTDSDRQKLTRFLTEPGQRARLHDVRSRGVEAMADFSRLTPDQSRIARRILVIPGWLMAGTRYPFHFAANHPIRSALLAYVALGEPGAPDGYQFNKPLDEYFSGSGYKRGIDTPYGRFRTGSLSPVSTPWELGGAIVQAGRGGVSPYDFAHNTPFDYVQPAIGAAVGIAKGEGVAGNLQRLAPNYGLATDLLRPQAGPNYPEDATRLGRLKREVGVLPIKVNDNQPSASRGRSRSGSSGGGSIYRRGGGSTGGSIYRR